jgi:dipeptide/tripeptide permease
VSPLSIWLQVPTVSLGAISECLCNVTAYELAYSRSPKNMRSLVVSLFLFMTAISSAIGQAIIPAMKDPYLTWVWGGPAIALGVLTVHFYFTYRHMDNDKFLTDDGYDDSVSEISRSTVGPDHDEKEVEK